VRPGQQARQAKAWRGTRHETRAGADLTPCLGLTNARMRPGANAHAAPAPAALGCRVMRSRPSLSLAGSLSSFVFLSLFNDLTGVWNIKLQPISRFLRARARARAPSTSNETTPSALPPSPPPSSSLCSFNLLRILSSSIFPSARISRNIPSALRAEPRASTYKLYRRRY